MAANVGPRAKRGASRGQFGGRGGQSRGGGRGGHSGRQQQVPLDLPVVEDCTYIDTHVHLEYILEKLGRSDGALQKSASAHSAEFEDCGASRGDSLAMERILRSFPAHANFEGCIAVFCDASALSPSLAVWPEFLVDARVWGAFGLHPHTAKYYTDDLELRIKEALQHEKAVAWGECGLDFEKMHSDKQTQIDVFKRQIEGALSVAKPIMVHSRKAADDTFKALAQNAPHDHPIHLHCFSDTADDALKYLAQFTRLVRIIFHPSIIHSSGVHDR